MYSGYIGGNAPTTGAGIAVDTSGNAFVTGETYALSGFPIIHAYQPYNTGKWGCIYN